METKSKLEVNDEELKRLNAVIGDDNEIMYFPGIARAIILDAHMNHEDPVKLAKDYMENAQQQAAQMNQPECAKAVYKVLCRQIAVIIFLLAARARAEAKKTAGLKSEIEKLASQVVKFEQKLADKKAAREAREARAAMQTTGAPPPLPLPDGDEEEKVKKAAEAEAARRREVAAREARTTGRIRSRIFPSVSYPSNTPLFVSDDEVMREAASTRKEPLNTKKDKSTPSIRINLGGIYNVKKSKKVRKSRMGRFPHKRKSKKLRKSRMGRFPHKTKSKKVRKSKRR